MGRLLTLAVPLGLGIGLGCEPFEDDFPEFPFGCVTEGQEECLAELPECPRWPASCAGLETLIECRLERDQEMKGCWPGACNEFDARRLWWECRSQCHFDLLLECGEDDACDLEACLGDAKECEAECDVDVEPDDDGCVPC